jgi:predicted component of type VI protein secretion system
LAGTSKNHFREVIGARIFFSPPTSRYLDRLRCLSRFGQRTTVGWPSRPCSISGCADLSAQPSIRRRCKKSQPIGHGPGAQGVVNAVFQPDWPTAQLRTVGQAGQACINGCADLSAQPSIRRRSKKSQPIGHGPGAQGVANAVFQPDWPTAQLRTVGQAGQACINGCADLSAQPSIRRICWLRQPLGQELGLGCFCSDV